MSAKDPIKISPDECQHTNCVVVPVWQSTLNNRRVGVQCNDCHTWFSGNIENAPVWARDAAHDYIMLEELLEDDYPAGTKT